MRVGVWPRALVAASVALSAALVGCRLPSEAMDTCRAGLLPGDLVITEIMANPFGHNAGGEWLELYNVTELDIELEGVTLQVSRGDDDEVEIHELRGGVIAPGQYFVAGNITPAFAPPYVDHGYGSDLSLPDRGGRVSVACDVVEVDAVVFPRMSEGVAWSLGSGIFPDALRNDDPTSWCDAITEYSPGNHGTPGAPSDCTAGPGSARCEDGDLLRPVEVPGPGDLVISEIMADPKIVSDAVGEWFEIYVARDLDLNGVGVGRDPERGADTILGAPTCLRVAAGHHMLFARNPDPAENGGLPPVDHTFGFGLANSSGRLFVGLGGEVLDEVLWTRSRAGASWSLDPEHLDPESNDDPGVWCTSAEPAYGDGELGTPGAPNLDCGIIVPGWCKDEGGPRPVVPPEAGQITITEYMANPEAVADTRGEWIEVRVDADVDLNGLQLGKSAGTVLSTIDASTCLRVEAGTYAVFARSADPDLNGGLPRVDGVFSFGLVNSRDRVFVAVDGVELDAVEYGSSAAGASTSLDESDGVTWCINLSDTYGVGNDTGTPGAANPGCL